MGGFILIDKPAGMTSHDVIDRLRKITGIRRIGHAGTLDPFATGLLIVGIGREATRRLSEFSGLDKEYIGTMVLGAVSDTQDGTGRITPHCEGRLAEIGTETIHAVLKKFTGRIQQIPPMFSAKKIGGRKLYELAREGKEVARKPVEVIIHELELVSYEPPRLTIRCRVSSGTYIRTLAHDIGQALGVGGYLSELRRTKIGELSVSQAQKLEDVTLADWRQLAGLQS